MGHDSLFRTQQAMIQVKKLRNEYFQQIRQTRSNRAQQDKSKVTGMSDSEKSKFLHSRIQASIQAKRSQQAKATYATMTFEGRRAVATELEQRQLLLNSYTHSVSMDTENTVQNEKIDCKSKRGLSSFNKGSDKPDEFDGEFKEQIDNKMVHIRRELKSNLSQPVDTSDPVNKLLTLKELKAAIKRLKPKLWKTCGSDGIHNWMVYLARDRFHKMLLQIYNACWQHGVFPYHWYET